MTKMVKIIRLKIDPESRKKLAREILDQKVREQVELITRSLLIE